MANPNGQSSISFPNCRSIPITKFIIKGTKLPDQFNDISCLFLGLDHTQTITWTHFEEAMHKINMMKQQPNEYPYPQAEMNRATRKYCVQLTLDDIDTAFDHIQKEKTIDYNHMNSKFDQLEATMIIVRDKQNHRNVQLYDMLQDLQKEYWILYLPNVRAVKLDISVRRERIINESLQLNQLSREVKQKRDDGLLSWSVYWDMLAVINGFIDTVDNVLRTVGETR